MPKIAEQVIVKVSSDVSGGCQHCNYQHTLDGIEHFADACNHLMQVHNLKCLHVGQETSTDMDGKPWQSTVAIFGL